MRWPVLTDIAEARLRLVLLLVAVIASVVLPYAMLQRGVSEVRDAASWVTHSASLKENTYELMYLLRDIENVALARYTGVVLKDGAKLYADGRARIDPLLEQLRLSTRDNEAQRDRVGNLQAIVQARVKLFDVAMKRLDEKNYDGAGDALNQSRELFPFRAVGREFLGEEEALFQRRTEASEKIQRNANLATLGALAAQLALLITVIFISERQIQRRLAAELQARNAIARSRAIVQTVREPIVVLDKSLRLVMSNAAFREVYAGAGGEDREDAQLGVAINTIGAGAWADSALMQRLADVVARNRELWDYELTQRSAEGLERDVLVNARSMVLPESSEPTILLTVNDVTARKRSEQKIHDLNRDLESKVAQISDVNRELESFSYSVSHDLRAPLRHIAGFADKLGAHLGAGADEKAHHYLEIIGSSARRMSTLIEDLLLYSRLGRNSLRLQAVDMLRLAEEIRAMLVTDAGAREIEWKIGGLPVVIGDEGMLRQVWQNLIGNAVKYTSRRSRALIEIGVERSDSNEVVFFVRDNGTGFDMQYAGKLFGVFQRLHKPTDFPGTGIGLANVRRIIGRHGGRTWAESAPDAGATFFFSMPALLPASATTEDPA